MTATVRDLRGVTHVAVHHAAEYDPGEEPVIGALCEDTVKNLLLGESFMAWSPDEIGEGRPDCMSCLAREGKS